jgi:methionyl-tRNA synthetase
LKKPQLIEEVNYFFRLSKFNAEIRRLIETDELKIYPESRKNEMLALVNSEDGLMDISFSRPKEALAWGVPVPNDPDHVMYVWCDALSNYITGLGYRENSDLFQSCWPADLQIIGKDILRFHAGIWIGMLLSAGLKPPRAILVHGFITSEGQKMSKSLGNVVDPKAIVSEFGQDAFRYYLLKEIPTTDDGDFTVNRFVESYNAHLANNFGNLISRVTNMLCKYFDGNLTDNHYWNSELHAIQDGCIDNYNMYWTSLNINLAINEAFILLNAINKDIEEVKPWKLYNIDPEMTHRYLCGYIKFIGMATSWLLPIIPHKSKEILQKLGLSHDKLYYRTVHFNTTNKIQPITNLFPRIESISQTKQLD